MVRDRVEGVLTSVGFQVVTVGIGVDFWQLTRLGSWVTLSQFAELTPLLNTSKSNDDSAEQPARSSCQGSDQSSELRRDAARTLEQLLDRATQYDSAAGPSTDAEEWFRGESESLLLWAKETGRLLSSTQLDEMIAGFKLLNGGLEHQVFFRKRTGRVFKITCEWGV